MGVRGLTTFIYQREHLYFEEILLKDCTLIIDGNSLVPHIYNSSLIHTSAFGGDYDKLAELTEKFFKRLRFNNVYSIVVFDGAVEKRKVATIKTRNKEKIMSLQNVTPQNVNGRCFPLLMRRAMKEKLIEMGIVVLQSDLEADSEIAALSKIYQVPVLSNDSDFFIYNVLYVPISTLSYGTGTNVDIECKVFRMEKFLAHLDLDSERLPLLAVILGNDYIARSELKHFLGQMKTYRHRSGSSQNLVAGVLRWLKSESVESALQKILSSKLSRGREVLRHRIIKIMRGYVNVTTSLTQYIPDVSKMEAFNLSELYDLDQQMRLLSCEEEPDSNSDDEIEKQSQSQDEESSSDGATYSASEPEQECSTVNATEVEAILEAGKQPGDNIPGEVFPEWLTNRSRRGLIDPDVLCILNMRTFFSTPQAECYDMTFSGEPYLRILQCLAGLLLGQAEIHIWYRQHRNKYERNTMTTINEIQPYGTFPTLKDMLKLSSHERMTLFHKILNVEERFLEGVPADWKLYIISITYWLKNDPNCELKPYHLHSVMMMMLTLLVVDKKIGVHRQRKSFVKKYGIAVGKISKTRRNLKATSVSAYSNITEAIDKVTNEDCILSFDSLIQNFHVDRQMRLRCSKIFSSTIVHSFARLQCCLAYASMLNSVLGSPYPDIKISAFYDGTFLYNVASNLKKRTNILAYIDSFFCQVPSLLRCYKTIYLTFQDLCPELVEQKLRKKVRKIKTEHIKSVPKEILTFDSDSEPFYDKNNRFCALFS